MSEIEHIPEDSQKKNNNGAFIAIIVILLLMLAAMAYFLSTKDSDINRFENRVKQLETEKKAMTGMLAEYMGDATMDLKHDFKQMLENYQALKEKDPKQAAKIDEQMKRIEGLLSQLEDSEKKNRINAGMINSLRKENTELRSIMRGYVYEIDSLNTLNLNLRSNLDETTTTLAQTTEEKNRLEETAAAQADKIKEGQRLSTYSVLTVGLKQGIGGTMKESKKAKNVKQIRCSFTLGKNDITEKGAKPIYMAVVGPDGKTLQNSSGNVITTEGGQVAYSDQKTIDFTGKSIDVAVFYSVRNQTLVKGNYKIKLYSQGQLIGTDNFILK